MAEDYGAEFFSSPHFTFTTPDLATRSDIAKHFRSVSDACSTILNSIAEHFLGMAECQADRKDTIAQRSHNDRSLSNLINLAEAEALSALPCSQADKPTKSSRQRFKPVSKR